MIFFVLQKYSYFKLKLICRSKDLNHNSMKHGLKLNSTLKFSYLKSFLIEQELYNELYEIMHTP